MLKKKKSNKETSKNLLTLQVKCTPAETRDIKNNNNNDNNNASYSCP